MFSFSNRVIFLFFLIIFLFKNSALSEATTENFNEILDNSSVIISLRNYSVSNPEGESIDSLYILPPYSMLAIVLTEIPDDVHFVVLQVHSYLVNVTLSLEDVPHHTNSIIGTNIGLLKMNSMSELNLSFYLTYNNTPEAGHVMLSVQAYSKDAPIPGGCNMEFPVEVSPFLKTTYDDVLTEVVFAPSAPPLSVFSKFFLFPSNECNIKPSPVQHKMYYYYLPERDFSKETYFDVLKSMMTTGRILKNGVPVPYKLTASPVKKVFATYPGTGRAFAVISSFGNYSAAYVPSFTYGCNELKNDNTCDVLTTTFSKVVCASMLFMGLFTCFFGHFFYRLEIFFFGFLGSGIAVYMLTANLFNREIALSTSVSLGLVFAVLLTILLTCICLPVISMVLATLTLGFLLASVIFYLITDQVEFFVMDINYWGVFIGIFVTCPILMLCLAEKANIMASAVVGSYMGIASIDHYLGSNLRYAVINIIRRVTVDKFRIAVTVPPFQLNDVLLSILWLVLTLLGKVLQRKLTKNMAPFPPPVNYFKRWNRSPRRRASRPGERTPLMSERLHSGFTPNFVSSYYDGN